MGEKNIFSDVSASKTKISNAIKITAKNFLPYILLVLIIACRVLLEIFHTTIVNPFNLVFFFETALNLSLTMFCYIVFIPQGKKNEELNSKTYDSNCDKWSDLSAKIRTGGLLEKFRIFCQDQLEVERKEIKAVIIGNHTTISFDEYMEKYANLNRKELRKVYKSGELSPEEYWAIKKCNGKIKVRPINSVLILSGVARANYNDAGRTNSSFISGWLAQRPILVVSLAILVKAISGSYSGFAPDAMYGMILDTLSIVIAAFVGYGAGEQAVRDREDKIKNRILFIENFLEKT